RRCDGFGHCGAMGHRHEPERPRPSTQWTAADIFNGDRPSPPVTAAIHTLPASHRHVVDDPAPRSLDVPSREPSNRRRYEMRGEVLRDGAERSVGDDGDLLDAAVMITDEAEMGDHGPETVPSGKRRDLDDETGESSIGLDVGVHGLRELDEVFPLERRLRSYVENRMRGIEAVFDHGSLLCACAVD